MKLENETTHVPIDEKFIGNINKITIQWLKCIKSKNDAHKGTILHK